MQPRTDPADLLVHADRLRAFVRTLLADESRVDADLAAAERRRLDR